MSQYDTPDEYVYVPDGETLPVIMNPKKQNCRFTGWTTNQVTTAQLDGMAMDINSGVEYHAVTINSRNSEDNYTLLVKDGTTIPYLRLPKKDGCRFTGWTTEEIETETEGTISIDKVKTNHEGGIDN